MPNILQKLVSVHYWTIKKKQKTQNRAVWTWMVIDNMLLFTWISLDVPHNCISFLFFLHWQASPLSGSTLASSDVTLIYSKWVEIITAWPALDLGFIMWGTDWNRCTKQKFAKINIWYLCNHHKGMCQMFVVGLGVRRYSIQYSVSATICHFFALWCDLVSDGELFYW